MSTIAIIGAGPGLGAATARAFGQRDFIVALISRSQANLDRLATDLAAATRLRTLRRGRRSHLRTVGVAALLAMGLAACTSGDDSVDAGMETSPSTSTSTSSADTPADAGIGTGTPITIRIGDRTATATVWDTPTGAALLDQLPLTLTFVDHNNVEKTARLSDELTMDGMPDGADPDAGDLGYYAPAGDVVLYYADAPYFAGIARIGLIDTGLDLISGQTGGDFSATLELAD